MPMRGTPIAPPLRRHQVRAAQATIDTDPGVDSVYVAIPGQS
jgi:hypothetical protein